MSDARAAFRRLTAVFLGLAAATVAAMIFGNARAAAAPGPLAITGVLAVAALKASFVLSDYLELRRAPAWLAGFRTALGFLVAALALLAVVA